MQVGTADTRAMAAQPHHAGAKFRPWMLFDPEIFWAVQ
jgi:hypothetical protein